jgi:predicted N-acetyltransferase YhbS
VEAVFRPYTAADREPVLALFDGNVGPYFLAGERAEMVSFLQRIEGNELGTYLVGIDDGKVVAAGGFARSRAPLSACLTWGMVDRSRHGQGIGRKLLVERIERIRRELPEARAITIETSQHTAPFFAKHGFAVEKVSPDGFGPGLHIHHMRRVI